MGERCRAIRICVIILFAVSLFGISLNSARTFIHRAKSCSLLGVGQRLWFTVIFESCPIAAALSSKVESTRAVDESLGRFPVCSQTLFLSFVRSKKAG